MDNKRGDVADYLTYYININNEHAVQDTLVAQPVWRIVKSIGAYYRLIVIY